MHSHDSQASGRRTEGGEPRTLSRRSLLAVGMRLIKNQSLGVISNLKLEKIQIEKEQGIIRPTRSPWETSSAENS